MKASKFRPQDANFETSSMAIILRALETHKQVESLVRIPPLDEKMRQFAHCLGYKMWFLRCSFCVFELTTTPRRRPVEMCFPDANLQPSFNPPLESPKTACVLLYVYQTTQNLRQKSHCHDYCYFQQILEIFYGKWKEMSNKKKKKRFLCHINC